MAPKDKEIKINFKNFWKGFDKENNLFVNLLKKKYKVIISEKPDYVFYSVYSSEKNSIKVGSFTEKAYQNFPNLYNKLRKLYLVLKKENKKKEIVHPEGDFVKIFYTAENVKPDMTQCDWAFSFYYDDGFKHPKHMRLPNYKFQELKNYEKQRKKKVDINKIRKEKIRFCNFIYSQDNELRNKFFKELSKYKKIDAPGRCMNNMPPIGEHFSAKTSRLSNNWITEKMNFLKKYKFTIAFESSSAPGYTTEKIHHPLLVNSIPIYFGNPLIHRDFNTKSFINVHDFKDIKKVVEHIIEVDTNNELYEKMLKEPIYPNKKSKYMDDKRIMKRLQEIFD